MFVARYSLGQWKRTQLQTAGCACAGAFSLVTFLLPHCSLRARDPISIIDFNNRYKIKFFLKCHL